MAGLAIRADDEPAEWRRLARQTTEPKHCALWPLRPRWTGRAGSRPQRQALWTARPFATGHAGAEVQLWFMDEARGGHKGRACHGWDERGERPPGLLDQRFAWAWLSAAGHPKSGEDVALVLASVSAGAMSVLLKPFGESLGSGVHAVLALDQAGWPGAKALKGALHHHACAAAVLLAAAQSGGAGVGVCARAFPQPSSASGR